MMMSELIQLIILVKLKQLYRIDKKKGELMLPIFYYDMLSKASINAGLRDL
jgi:hypothetical protein